MKRSPRLTVDDFNTVNEGLKHFIANIPISRIRGLVKHVENQFQVLQVLISKQSDLPSNCEPIPQSVNEIDPIFNFLTLETDVQSPRFKYDTNAYKIPVGRAFKILQDTMALFVCNSKLITDFVYFFQVRRKLHGSRSNRKSKGYVFSNLETISDGGHDENDVCSESDDDDDDDVDDDGGDENGEKIPDIEIVCGEGVDATSDDVEVEDLFGTTTILPGKCGKSESLKAEAHTETSRALPSDDLFPPESTEYKKLVEVFSISAATVVISQVDICSILCLMP